MFTEKRRRFEGQEGRDRGVALRDRVAAEFRFLWGENG